MWLARILGKVTSAEAVVKGSKASKSRSRQFKGTSLKARLFSKTIYVESRTGHLRKVNVSRLSDRSSAQALVAPLAALHLQLCPSHCGRWALLAPD
jgi:hypothetical protein